VRAVALSPPRQGAFLELYKRVLVVEDQPLILLSVCEALEAGGYATLAISTGIEAATLIEGETGQFAALVTDVRLGQGLDGWALAQRARELNPDLAVVYMSGDSAPEHGERGVKNSMMIQKPFVGSQIVRAVSALLNLQTAQLLQK